MHRNNPEIEILIIDFFVGDKDELKIIIKFQAT